MREAISIVTVSWIAAVAAGCSVDSPSLTGRRCPCVEGWICDADRDVCVPAGGDGDADSDADSDADVGACDLPLEELPLGGAISATTSDAPRDLEPECSDGQGDGQPNVAFTLTFPEAGWMSIAVEAADEDHDGDPDWDAVLEAREVCDDRDTAIACVDDENGSWNPAAWGCVPDAGTIVLIVDGYGTLANDGLQAGDFDMTIDWAVCDWTEVCIDAVGCATLEDESNDTADQAQRMQMGEYVAADLSDDADVDWYVMYLNEGEFISFDADDVCISDVVLFLYADPPPDPAPTETVCDPDNLGAALDCADGEPCEELHFTAPADGDYYLRIVGYRGQVSGDYVIEADPD